MSLDVVSRRLELLRLEGFGISQIEIVRQLSERFGCSNRTVYNDFETRASWQPMLQSAVKSEDVLLKICNRYEQIYRHSSKLALSSNSSVQLGALKIMLKTNYLMFETLVLPDIVCRLKVLEQKANRGVFVP